MNRAATVRGLDHVSVTTGDLDRSLAFYRDLLGLAVRESGESGTEQMATIVGLPHARFRYADLELGGGQILELLQYLEPVGKLVSQRTCDPGSGHIALAVTDVVELYGRLVDAGVTVRSAPVTIDESEESSAISVTSIADSEVATSTDPGEARGVRAIQEIDADAITIEEPGGWDGVRVLYALDPDGVTVELVQRPGRA